MRPEQCLLWIAILFSSLSLSPAFAAGTTFDIDATSWQQPRSAVMVKSLPAVKSAMQIMLNKPGAQMVIRHRDDEEGTLWGAELRDWMISLGVKPAAMRLEVMALGSAALQLEVLGAGGVSQ